MSVRSFKKSIVILAFLNSKGFKMPLSESTIWCCIDKFYADKKTELISKIKEILDNNGRFSIIVDEWSDISYYKYVNVSLRYFDPLNSTFEVLT